MLASPAVAAPFQSASLYVGDLLADITENVLFDLFNRVGPVASIRVCRDSITRRSLGYAYVNFHNVQDAERALDTMNFTEINGKPCRIMWSQRDPSLRKTGLGNVFVRNLAPSVDNKGLYDTFSVFGNILSCKVANDEHGSSKRYGYVHFETAEAAQDAIQKLDGMFIDDVKVSVSHFVRRQDRAGQNTWTNLYIKQFPLTWDEAKLKEIFQVYGPTQSIAISRDADGKSKGFAFVNMADHESAAKAVNDLHNKQGEEGGNPYTLYVGKAQKKSDRLREIKSRQDSMNVERVTKYQGMNLYVKNISDTVTDEQFKEEFAPFGTITSARIMRDGNDLKTSKGFGFVCFSTTEEANKAVEALNGKVLGGKPLVVTLYQRKEHRRAQLAASYAPQNMRFPQNMGGVPMPFMGMYMPQGQGFPGQQPRGMPYSPFMPRGAPQANLPRGAPMNFPPQRAGFFPAVPQFIQPGQGQPGMPQNFNQGNRRPMAGPGGPQQQPLNNAPRPQHMQQGGPRPIYGAPQMGGFPQQQQGQPRGNIKFNNQARNQNAQVLMPGQMMPPPMQQPMMMGAQKMDFSDALLATTDPLQQKNMIGERLYPLIYQHQPELAGKITGMLLEMDNGELLNLIESPDALTSKIDEALSVLRSHSEN